MGVYKLKPEMTLFLDEVNERLLYAECDRFMADILISFLTTPVGALVRRTGMKSGLGCIDNLYESVEKLDVSHFRTRACRQFLLHPRNAFGFAYHRLRLSVNDASEDTYCCRSKRCHKYSLLPGQMCVCGRPMDFTMPLLFPTPATSDVVFIREDLNSFVVTDDLFIAPSTDELKRSICDLAGVEYGPNGPTSSGRVRAGLLRVSNSEIVELIKRSVHSNTPLTDTFLPSRYGGKPLSLSPECLKYIIKVKSENICFLFMNKLIKLGIEFIRMLDLGFESRKMEITLFHDEERVHYAIAGRNFIDLVFSFLTFPFGSIVAAVGGRLSLGCLDNLHQVVKRFISDGNFYKENSRLDICGNYLLDPPIALHHSCENNVLKIGKRPFSVFDFICDASCMITLGYECEKKHISFKRKPINPKWKKRRTTKCGGGYVEMSKIFLITDNLEVRLIDDIEDNEFPATLDRKKVNVGEKEALKLLMASLSTSDSLTTVFHPMKGSKKMKKD